LAGNGSRARHRVIDIDRGSPTELVHRPLPTQSGRLTISAIRARMPSVSTPQHSRLINAAAKVVLRPLGCVQKGRSRTWLDDRVWWVGVVEFQPSSWAKGSYLNVGACWLWYEKDFLSFDAGYRVESFHPFTGNEAFELVAEKLAERASHEVTALRERFPSPSHVQSWIAAKPRTSIWDHYHLAVSAGLAGATDQSKRSLLM